LTTWINTIGIKRIAKKLDVNITTVHHWKRRFALPRPEQMKAIKHWSHSEVTYTDMIESFLNHKAKLKNQRLNKKKKKTKIRKSF
jgi:DNA-binding transcriptional MerR regulator